MKKYLKNKLKFWLSDFNCLSVKDITPYKNDLFIRL